MTAPGRPEQWLLPSWPWSLRAVGVACLIGAELAQVVGLGTRFTDGGWPLAAIAAAEGVLAGWLIVRPSRAAYVTAVGGGVAVVAWGLLSPGPGPPHPALHWLPLVLAAVAAAALLPMAARAELRLAAAEGRAQGGSAVAAGMIAVLVTGVLAAGAVSDDGLTLPGEPPHAHSPGGS